MVFRVVRPKIIVIGLTFFSIAPLMAVFLSTVVSPWYHTLPLLIMAFGAFFYWVHFTVIRRIVVNESGIEYRTLFTRIHKNWADVKFISVGYYPLRQEGTPVWITFADDYSPHESPLSPANSSVFLRVHYRKAIITEILKFYDKEIAGLWIVEKA